MVELTEVKPGASHSDDECQSVHLSEQPVPILTEARRRDGERERQPARFF